MELNGASATLDQIKALALTNYGHFTSMLAVGSQVRGLSLHMQRLSSDCRHLFQTELDTELVRSHIRTALAGQQQPTVVRVTIYDPSLDLGTIGTRANPHVLVTTRSAATAPLAPLRLQAVAYQREIPAVKHVGLFGALHLRRMAQREGADDVLFLNPDGTIAEIATSNVGFIRGERVIWPRSEYLSGVTMRLLHQALDEPVTSEALRLSDLTSMDAAFATNAATGIRPIASIDCHSWPTDHSRLRRLTGLYADIPSETV